MIKEKPLHFGFMLLTMHNTENEKKIPIIVKIQLRDNKTINNSNTQTLLRFSRVILHLYLAIIVMCPFHI